MSARQKRRVWGVQGLWLRDDFVIIRGMQNKRQPALLRDILAKYDPRDKRGRYISQEFQDYGYRLALDLEDLEHKALYIKLAKTVKRERLEAARAFAVDAAHAQSRARLFMWKLRQLRQGGN